MKTETTRYIKISNDSQVKITMVVEEERLPAPHEQNSIRELTADEFETATTELKNRNYSTTTFLTE